MTPHRAILEASLIVALGLARPKVKALARQGFVLFVAGLRRLAFWSVTPPTEAAHLYSLAGKIWIAARAT
jgi:hypothetical protein